MCETSRDALIEATKYNKQAFVAYLQKSKDEGGKQQELETAKGVASFVGTFVKSGKTADDFIKSYTKPNSYNNALNSIKHYCDFLGVSRPNLKQKLRTPTNLIIPPKQSEVIEIIHKIKSDDVKAYLALCATVGLRPERLRLVKWSQIDFENNWVNINERHGKKVYRPNCLHKDVAVLLRRLRIMQDKQSEILLSALRETSIDERVFAFGYKKVQQELKAIDTKWRPSNLRDFFYNTARKHCDHDQIEWAMGHSLPGVRTHYLADELKQEYAKFEQVFSLNTHN